MSFLTIDPNKIKVGDPITKEIFDLIRTNFDDHESRLNAFEAGAVKIPVFDFEIVNNTMYPPSMTGIAYYTARQAFTITDCFIQIFEKGTLTGTIQIDIKKSAGANLSDGSFTSIFSTKPSVAFASASDYARSTNQILNAGQAIAIGEVLRLDLSAIPTTGFIDRFIVCCYGEI